jgi:hypothetical protein
LTGRILPKICPTSSIDCRPIRKSSQGELEIENISKKIKVQIILLSKKKLMFRDWSSSLTEMISSSMELTFCPFRRIESPRIIMSSQYLQPSKITGHPNVAKYRISGTMEPSHKSKTYKLSPSFPTTKLRKTTSN